MASAARAGRPWVAPDAKAAGDEQQQPAAAQHSRVRRDADVCLLLNIALSNNADGRRSCVWRHPFLT